MFRYLSEGKLYLIDSKAAFARRESPVELKYAGKSCTYEYLWLCASCCRGMTIQISRNLEVKVARKGEDRSHFEPNMPAA